MSSLLGVSQKCQYALRAMLELSLRYPAENVTTVGEIAEAQKIPIRFLEQILSKLRAGGYVESRRGKQGGYVIGVAPSGISIGEIIRFIEGPSESVQCIRNPEGKHCSMQGGCVFKSLWMRAKDAMSEIFDSTTFQNLVDQHRLGAKVLDYTI